MAFDAAQENGVISLLVARIRRTFKGRSALPQAGTTADAFLEVVRPVGEFIRRRTGEVHGQCTLRACQNAQNEMWAADEGVRTARIVANAPEYERRRQRHRGKGIDGHALAFAVRRHGGHQANPRREGRQGLPKGSCIGGLRYVARDQSPGIHTSSSLSAQYWPFGVSPSKCCPTMEDTASQFKVM